MQHFVFNNLVPGFALFFLILRYLRVWWVSNYIFSLLQNHVLGEFYIKTLSLNISSTFFHFSSSFKGTHHHHHSEDEAHHHYEEHHQDALHAPDGGGGGGYGHGGGGGGFAGWFF